MLLSSVPKARALAFLEIDGLNLSGKVRLADCVAPLVEKYNFLAFPKELKDFDLGDKGVRFEAGKAGELTIEALVIYDGAMYVETPVSTEDSKRILMEMLDWGRKELGLTYSPNMIRKWGYVSQIVFQTDFPLLELVSPPLANLAKKVSLVTEELWDGLQYYPTNVAVGHDPTIRKHPIASLFIQHRANTRFEENKFFSEAPLPTPLHIKFLEEFEAEVVGRHSESR